jgi:hypothetical protein
MIERLGIIHRLFRRPEPPYTPFNIEDWQRKRDGHTLTEPIPAPPAAEQSPIPTPRNSGEAYPSPLARILAPLKAARQKVQTR